MTVAAMAAATLSACSLAPLPLGASPPPAPAPVPISGQVVAPTDRNQQGGGQDNSQVIAQLGQRSSEGGYWPASVQLGHNSLGSVVVDGQGFTLYRFDKDSAKPPTSNCTGTCLTQWPPVLARGGRITTQNLDPGQIGSITRPDGTQQLTIGGWPAYRYINDVVPGEAKGQRVGGVWFVLAPDGSKAGVSKKYGH